MSRAGLVAARMLGCTHAADEGVTGWLCEWGQARGKDPHLCKHEFCSDCGEVSEERKRLCGEGDTETGRGSILCWEHAGRVYVSNES